MKERIDRSKNSVCSAKHAGLVRNLHNNNTRVASNVERISVVTPTPYQTIKNARAAMDILEKAKW